MGSFLLPIYRIYIFNRLKIVKDSKMWSKLANPTAKKINKARVVYDTYCKVGTLEKTREATGCAFDTIRRYIALIENIDSRSKLSSKDRYYTKPDNTDNNIYIDNTNIDNIKDNKDNSINSTEVITESNIPSLKDTKNKILLSKLNTISTKYLDYLDDPSDERLEKTSLKDRAVIAGILLDKKILLEHKQADVIRNQSIIFNLFGDNKNLASFISDAVGRQKRLSAKPTKKYILAGSKE